MKKIGTWNEKELELGDEFDAEKELELTILDKNNDDVSVWLTKQQIKRMIEHLVNVL